MPMVAANSEEWHFNGNTVFRVLEFGLEHLDTRSNVLNLPSPACEFDEIEISDEEHRRAEMEARGGVRRGWWLSGLAQSRSVCFEIRFRS